MASVPAVLPEGFRLSRASGTITISWKGPTHWVFVFVGALGAVISGILLASVMLASQRLSGAPIVFGAGLFASGYLFLLGLCNRTRIRICEGRMQAKHGPLPCLFPAIFHVGCRKGIPIEEIDELRVEPEGKPDPMTGRLPTYAFHVAKHDGAGEKLLTRMELEDARPLGKALAEAIGMHVVLPEEAVQEGAVCRLRRP